MARSPMPWRWRTALAGTCLLLALGVQAAGDPARLAVQRTPHDAWFGLAFDARLGVAVGAFGAMALSQDGGASWQALPATTARQALLGVAVRAGHGIAVGQGGAVLVSDDCRQWRAVGTGSPARLNAVAMNRKGQAWAVGAFGTVLRSQDWGHTWTVLPQDWSRIADKLEGEPHLYGVQVDDNGQVTVAGEFELILRSGDGVQWKVLHQGERSLFGLRLVEGGRGLAVGQSGAVLTTRDGGSTWQDIASGSQAILTDVDLAPDGRAVATGINTVLTSRDGGATWQPLPSRLTRRGWQQTVAVAQEGPRRARLYTAGAGGTILEINDEETR